MTLVRSASIDGAEGPDHKVQVVIREGARSKQRVLDSETLVPDSGGPHKPEKSNNAKRH